MTILSQRTKGRTLGFTHSMHTSFSPLDVAVSQHWPTRQTGAVLLCNGTIQSLYIVQCWTLVPLIDAATNTVYEQELVESHFVCHILRSCLFSVKLMSQLSSFVCYLNHSNIATGWVLIVKCVESLMHFRRIRTSPVARPQDDLREGESSQT